MFNQITLIILFFLAAFSGSCKKNNKPPRSPGNFVAKLDGTNWNGHEFKCIYHPRFNDICIYAVDVNSRNRLELIAYLNPANPVSNYRIQGNGTHYANVYIDCKNAYYTDVNDNLIKGNIELLKFDTVARKASGRFHFNSFSTGKSDYLVVSEGRFEDIEIQIDTSLPFRGSFIQATFNDTTHWYSSTAIFSDYDNSATILNIYTGRSGIRRYEGPIDGCTPQDFSSRDLYFSLRMDQGLGTFNVYPDEPPYEYEPRKYNLCKYDARAGKFYVPVKGSVTINYIDVPSRKCRGSFELELRDSLNRSIKITNGIFAAERWFGR